MFQLFKKKNKENKSKSGRYFQLKVKEVINETNEAATLIFENPENGMPYKPGQFLTLILPIGQEQVRRSYSLSSSPHLQENPSITVKRVESGKVSNYLNDHMKPGDTFDVMEPAGHFVPELQESEQRKYVLFAAGSGITPIISILKSVLHVEKDSQVILVYQNRDEKSIIFRHKLNEIEATYGARFKQLHVLSQPTEKWSGYSGRLDSAMTSDILMDIAANKISSATYFLCGPSGFMKTVFETLIEFEVPEKQIHRESFFSGEQTGTAPKTAPADSQSEYKVKILVDGETYDVEVPSNKTILEAALDQDIDMPFSCQSGLCTACRGKLLQGNVEMEEEEGLSEEELNEGYILNCVSKPTGPDVVVEIC